MGACCRRSWGGDSASSKPDESEDVQKVWHISYREKDGKWQVIRDGSTMATKLFVTKSEAEEYAKGLVANNEGSKMVIHNKDD